LKRCFLLLLVLLAGVFHHSVLTTTAVGVGAEERIVRGNSLSPLIKAGDRIEIHYDVREIRRGDIVAVRRPGRLDPIVKIVKGLPGDRFQLREAKEGVNVLVNGEVLKNSSGQPYKFSGKRKKMLSLYEKDYGGVIPGDAYLLLGNMVSGSLDSTRFGLIDKEEIMGKVRPAEMEMHNRGNK